MRFLRDNSGSANTSSIVAKKAFQFIKLQRSIKNIKEIWEKIYSFSILYLLIIASISLYVKWIFNRAKADLNYLFISIIKKLIYFKKKG